MKSPGLLVITASLCLGLAASAQAFDPGAVAGARRDLQSAVNHGDLGAMMSVRARLSALSQAEPGSALLHYWVAVAAWRAIPLEMAKDKDLAERIGDDALDHIEKALAIDSKFAEALAMKGGLQGILISLKPGSMMTLGPQSGANIMRGATLQPDNPRIHLLAGVGVLHKPTAFGGGPKPAIEEFQRAQELFAKESVADSTAPDWGRDDAFLWQGRAAMEMKNYGAARDAYRLALEANPDNGWVRTQLLPAAEKALGKTSKP